MIFTNLAYFFESLNNRDFIINEMHWDSNGLFFNGILKLIKIN